MNTEVVAHLDPTVQGFVPVADWPAVTTMIEGFGAPSLPASEVLAGFSYDLHFEDGGTVHASFSGTELIWGQTAPDSGNLAEYPYRAVEVRPHLIFVDFVTGVGVHAKNISLIVDLASEQVTYCESFFVDRAGEIRMRTNIFHGAIGQAAIVPRVATSELVGKRIYYRYSAVEHYEHVYLNAGTFVWHCVRGGEVGLADADPIQVFSLADGVVLLHWSETVMPVESIVAIDLHSQRSIGRMFCWDGPTLEPVRIPFDSEFEVLSDMQYPEQ